MQYIPEYSEARKSEKIVWERNISANITRASLPCLEVKNFFVWLKKQLNEHQLFDEKSLESLRWIGSTRQYLEEGFQNPYAGDIDVIIQLPVGQELIEIYLHKQIKPILEKIWVRYQQSFWNISIFVPVQQEVSHEPLYIQVDIMLAPEDERVFLFMKQIRYFSGEPYALISWKYYLKWVHTAVLLENMLQTKWYLMDNFGIYHEQWKTLDEKTKDQLKKVFDEKKNAAKKKSKKLKIHAESLPDWLYHWFPLSGQWVTSDNKNNILPDNQKLYEEIEHCLTENIYEKDFESFLSDVFWWQWVRTFEEWLIVIKKKFTDGLFTQEEIQSICIRYATRLIDKNKGTLRFPELQQKIALAFPFVDFSEAEAFIIKKQEKKQWNNME
jgi:hypothetical protein